MGTGLADSGLTWNDVLSTWSSLDAPEGWRPEITPEGITMSPPPSTSHALVLDDLSGLLRANLTRELAVVQNVGIALPSIGAIFIPDLVVAPRRDLEKSAGPLDAGAVLLAVEVTSPNNASHDRLRKRWAYAHGPIPTYLMIDPFDDDGPALHLFTDPADGVYSTETRTPYGRPVLLPAPIDVSLDSSDFPLP